MVSHLNFIFRKPHLTGKTVCVLKESEYKSLLYLFEKNQCPKDVISRKAIP